MASIVFFIFYLKDILICPCFYVDSWNMEVINYVGFNNKPVKMNSFKRYKTFNSSVNLGFTGSVSKTVSLAKPAGERITFKMFLVRLGNLSSYLISNVKYILAGLLGIVLISAIGFASYKVINYFCNTTGPLVLEEQSESCEDPFELLNKAMASFALEENGISSDGTLINNSEKINVQKLFRQPVTFQTYKVQPGDHIGGITKKFGLTNISTLIAVNDIDNVRALRAGQKLKIPSMDGLFYTVERGNSIASICSKFGITQEDLLDVNDIESADLAVGQKLFIPGARLDSKKLQMAMGEQFKNPLSIRYRLTSKFGPRIDPISGHKRSHTGIDMACPVGSPISACGAGTVAASSFHQIYGNYVIIKHSNGYQTLYAHMSKIFVQKGQWVSQGTRIGLVGSTGYSTGPHLHLSVYKNGQLVDPLTVIK